MRFVRSILLALLPPLGFLVQTAAAAALPAYTKSLRGCATPADDRRWWTKHNLLFYGDDAFHLKGINWNGFESDCNVVHGLWAHSVDHYLDILQGEGFNAIRIPLSFESMENLEWTVNPQCTTADAALYEGITVRNALGVFLDKLRDRGMFALFDMHTIAGVITEYPWTDDVDEVRVIAAWTNFGQVFGQHSAIMGFEIKNEPHGMCTTSEFHAHAARVIRSIGDRFPGLYFIDGTAQSSMDPPPPWGGTFEMIAASCACDDLCVLDMPQRIVFSPHVYGPDVRGPSSADEDDAVFEKRFGFLKKHSFFNQSAIVVTEFGGHIHGSDHDYFARWISFMQTNNLAAGAFFWTFPPSSADTGGLLQEDYETLESQKAQFLRQLQPRPTNVLLLTGDKTRCRK